MKDGSALMEELLSQVKIFQTDKIMIIMPVADDWSR